MSWPTPQEYHEAVQNPHQNFSDPELQNGRVETNAMGLPRVVSGNFASVYKMRCGDRFVAVRCFLRDIADQDSRYAAISQFIMSDDLSYTVGFDYLKEGLRIGGRYVPILKMDWVDGEPLDSYIRTHAENSERMSALSATFEKLVLDVSAAGIAHGDYQHGNILVIDDGAELRLVDYDGMFVPQLHGLVANELGHRHYQHPGRSREHFGPYLDCFSAWSILTSLRCLTIDGSLLKSLHGGDECLLFRDRDYRSPLDSRVFYALEFHKDENVRHAARVFRNILAFDPSHVPSIATNIEKIDSLPPLHNEGQLAFSEHASVPDWLKDAADAMGASHETISTERLEPTEEETKRGASNEPFGIPDPFPSKTQYLRALKMPSQSFSWHSGLGQMKLAVDDDEGKPTYFSETDESLVYRVQIADRYFAIKLFLSADQMRKQRYEETSAVLRSLHGPLADFFVPMEYVDLGIKINGNWYPIVKMPWVGGITLRELIKTGDKDLLLEASQQFQVLMYELWNYGIVHGNVEPSNFMMSGGHLKALDYDTLRRGMESRFLWREPNPNYRHPMNNRSFGLTNDHFSSWVLDTALVSMANDPRLRNYLTPSGDLLSDVDLKRARDWKSPEMIFQMRQSESKVVRNREALLNVFVKGASDEVPRLGKNAALPSNYAIERGLFFQALSPKEVSPDKLDSALQGPAVSGVPAMTQSNNQPLKKAQSDQEFVLTSLKMGGVAFWVLCSIWGMFGGAANPLVICFLFLALCFIAVKIGGRDP